MEAELKHNEMEMQFFHKNFSRNHKILKPYEIFQFQNSNHHQIDSRIKLSTKKKVKS